MDTDGKLNKVNNDKGFALVYLALLVVVLMALVGLAVDVGYMYVTKGQLQNASDAAALAGASQLKSVGTGSANPNDLMQTNARSAAILFASKNQAAQKNVTIANDNSNELKPENDIRVGRWNGTTFNPSSTPVNAIEVRARRTADSPDSDVSTFFARVLGWNTMGASASAIAALPVRANGFFAICTESCTGVSTDPSNPTTIDPPRQYDRDPSEGTPNSDSFAWSSLLTQVSSTTNISPLICSEVGNVDVCGHEVWTTQGTSAAIFKDMEAAFNDPTFDRDNKEISGNNVSAWWLYVPVTRECKPGAQPKPLDVWGYAWLRVISVCDTGGGGGSLCRPYSTHHCLYPQKIVIDRIACVDCNDPRNASGTKAVLVK